MKSELVGPPPPLSNLYIDLLNVTFQCPIIPYIGEHVQYITQIIVELLLIDIASRTCIYWHTLIHQNVVHTICFPIDSFQKLELCLTFPSYKILT